jgi:hypothetical protein
MSLLTICTDIVKETKSSSVPNVIIGNNDDVAQQILQVVKISITDLARNYQWQELQREYSFSSVIDQATYNLPSDFDRIIDNTFWNASQNWAMIGGITPENWRILKNSLLTQAETVEYYRIRNNQIVIHRTPSVVENYVFEYISKNIVKSSSNVEQSEFLADTDVPAIDEYILRLDITWRWLKNNGRAYADEKNIAEKAISERIKANGSRGTINSSPVLKIYNAQISAFKPILIS